MKETKVYPQSEADQDFAKLLKNIRTEEKVSLDQLAMGFMSASQLVKIENGERPINKNIRDRLLERLGIAKELYENLLDLCDFEEWDYKKKILSAIQDKKIEDAYRLLKEYKAHLRENDRINHQFILAMWGEVLKQEGASKEKIAECYRKAVILTIPDAEKVWWEKRPLSVLEMNLLLETIIYGNNMDYLHKCRVLMEYIDTGYYDEIMKAKIYPKIVYYYLKKQILFKEYWNVETQTENLKICEKAIDKLRDAGRTYYLVELLEIEIQILDTFPEDFEKNEADKINAKELLSVIKNLYAEYEVPAYIQDCTYFYQQKWIFSMKDVLRTRRAMFGLTQEQLCEGICSVKSLRRAEKGQTDMQRETLKKILNRLGLSGQMQWSRLITSDREVIRMAEELAEEEDLVLLCGHYEGIDERVLEEIVTDYVSIGDYVLTGGELPAMVMVDTISRLVPGVLHNDVSAEFESFQDNLLEYPQYSRPEEWHGKKVPPVLLSGHHANIEKWRREQSILRTYERRPDLLEKSSLTWKEKKWLEETVKEKTVHEEPEDVTECTN